MRIGIPLTELPPAIGGGHTFQSEIFQTFLKIGGQSHHTFTVLCHADAIKRLPEIRLPNVEVVPLDAPVRSIPLRAARKLRLYNRPRPFEEQSKAAGIDFLWLMAPPDQHLDTPYLTVMWDIQHRVQPWFPEVSAGGIWREREVLYGSTLQRAAAVIVGTEAGKRELELFYRIPASRILIAPHPTPRFALMRSAPIEPLPERYKLPKKFVLYPAQFWAHKNHVNLVLAVEMLVQQLNRPITAVLVGSDQGNLHHVEKLIKDRALDDHIRILGFVPRNDLIGLYRNAFALTYVSFFGPENLPPLEAFALGCPVIAADVEGAREQLSDGALYIDPKSPRQIADAVIRLENDKGLRSRMIEVGRKLAAERKPETFVEKALAFMDQFEAVRRCWAGELTLLSGKRLC
jgi:glycosyltransferase involved in cell wall biosynthesis